MRGIQLFDFKHEEDFMALERKFAEMEVRRVGRLRVRDSLGELVSS
jgi:hypothetical protein